MHLLICFSTFAVLVEGHSYFHPFYMETLAPCVADDLLKLRVNEFSLRTMTFKLKKNLIRLKIQH